RVDEAIRRTRQNPKRETTLPCPEAFRGHSSARSRRRSALRAGLARPRRHRKHGRLRRHCQPDQREESADSFYVAAELLSRRKGSRNLTRFEQLAIEDILKPR